MKRFFLTSLIIFNLVLPSYAQEQNIYSIAYVNRLQDKVKSNWIVEDGNLGKKTKIVFNVNKSGSITEALITESSGDKEFDALAMFALRSSEPFENFPSNYDKNEMKVEFSFADKGVEALQIEELAQSIVDNASQCEQKDSIQEIPISEISKFPKEDVKISKLKKIQDYILFKPYLIELNKKIKSNWFPYAFNGQKEVVLAFKIKKNGELSNLKVNKTSNDKKFDEVALKAVSNSAPFDVLPDKFNGNFVEVLFTFNYDSNNPKFNDFEGNYAKQLEIILNNCLPPKNYFLEKYLVVKIKIQKDGKVSSVEIVRSSNDEKFDALNVNALRACAFPPIPDEISNDSISINYVIKTPRPKCFGSKVFCKSFWYTLDDNLLNKFRGIKN